MAKIFLPSVVTGWNMHGWRKQISGVSEIGLSGIALFLTGIGEADRRECYGLLEKIEGLKIPFVHARSDMGADEFQLLIDKFGTKKFNLHPFRVYAPTHDLEKYYPKIFIENGMNLCEEDLQGMAGICLDLTHLENLRLIESENYQVIRSLLEKYPVGANHISVITDTIHHDKDGSIGFDDHIMESFSQTDYLKHYPVNYFGEFIAIELVNPINEQLKLIQYLKQGPLAGLVNKGE